MKRHSQPLLAVSGLLLGIILCLAHFPSLTEGYTGAPGEPDCGECHTTPLSTMSGDAFLEGLPDYVVGGQAYALKVVMNTNNSVAKTAGFQITFLNQNGTSNGSLQAFGSNVGVATFGNRQYAQHDPAIEFNTGGIGNEFEFEFLWTPDDVTDPVNINGYAATILGNGNQLTAGGQRQDSMLRFTFNTTVVQELIAAILETESPTCNGDDNGALQIIASGGIAPLEFEWSNGETSSTNTGLEAGVYSVTITDQSDQEIILSYELEEPTTLDVETLITSPSCHDATDGEIIVDPSGGTPPYTFIITDIGSGNPAVAIGEGSYLIQVSDENGCTQEAEVFVDAPDPLVVSLVAIQHETEAQLGFIFVDAAGGTTPYTFFWEAANSNFTSIGQNPVNLPADIYTLTLTDENGCETTLVVEIEFMTSIGDPTIDPYPVTISPNPGSDYLHITFPHANPQGWILRAYNAHGLFMSTATTNSELNFQWKQSETWAPGTYHIIAENQAAGILSAQTWIKI